MTPDSRIKLRHLACFLEVANRRSFGAAAEALAITQPAVSKAIAELEAILGVAVFERSRRGVFLTGYGEAFQRYAGASLTALRQGVDSVSQAQARGGQTLAVGALPTTAARIMPAAVQRAKAEGLGATLRIVTGPNEVLLTQLREGGLDLVVGRLAEPRQVAVGGEPTGVAEDRLRRAVVGGDTGPQRECSCVHPGRAAHQHAAL